MVQLGAFLDTGDKVASIVGAVAGLAGLWFAVRAGRRRRRAMGPGLTALLHAQRADSARHRYRFFGEHVPALTAVYVRPRASLGGPGREQSRTVQATRMLTAHRHAVLLGDAGAGKSTFLATVAGDLARQALARRRPGDLAVIVRAADLVGRTLPEALVHAVRRDLGVELPPETFQRPPRHGTWRILVDGLDEVIAAQDRSEVLWRIRDLLGGTTAYRFLLACRPLAESELGELRGPGVGAYDLKPFDRRELGEFARRWFTARYPDDRRRADATAGRFLARVAGARLGPVARIPLLATIAALVFEQQSGRALPSSRAALYERFVDHLLDGRRSLDRFREAIEPELLSRGVAGRELADWLCADIHRHVGGLLDACGAAWLTDPETRLTDAAAAWVRANGPHDLTRVTPDGDRLLRELLLTSGVCTLRREQVVFAHQSFAEFFAARAADATFDTQTWLATAANPATRSLVAFAAARRPESDDLVTRLLTAGATPNASSAAATAPAAGSVPDTGLVAATGLAATTGLAAAGDLLADGVAVRPETRARIVDLLLAEIVREEEPAPEALRVLSELSLDADVLRRMIALAEDPAASVWTRALVAGRVADIDPVAGNRLLREVAAQGDEVVLSWVSDTLAEHGAGTGPHWIMGLPDQVAGAGGGPLGVLARQALARRLTDARATDADRLAAARQLAAAGDRAPLRAMAEAVDLDPLDRVRAADALADAGEPEALRRFDTGSPQAAYAAAVALSTRDDVAGAAKLRDVADRYATLPLAYGAAARSAELGDLIPLQRLVRRSGQPMIRLAAARRLAALGHVKPLGWMLEQPLPPDVAAMVLSELVGAGRADAVPRLAALLRRHRLRPSRVIDMCYLLAGQGHQPSRERLYRFVRWPSRAHLTVWAATALTALADPRGPRWLRRIARQHRRFDRTRMRAAGSLARVDPAAGRPLLEELAAPGSPPNLRFRAAATALSLWEAADPLLRIAQDPGASDTDRAKAVDLLAPTDIPESLVPQLTVEQAPAPVRIAAARLLPYDQGRTVLVTIADDRRNRPRVRCAAIRRLDAIDHRAAGAAFGRLLRDRRVPRPYRWWLATLNLQLLADSDATVVTDRLGDPDTVGWRQLAVRLLRLLPADPERILGEQKRILGEPT
jgi:hypothetical protein